MRYALVIQTQAMYEDDALCLALITRRVQAEGFEVAGEVSKRVLKPATVDGLQPFPVGPDDPYGIISIETTRKRRLPDGTSP